MWLGFTFFLSFFGLVVGEVCPGGEEKCPGSMTCCEIVSNHSESKDVLSPKYGCCPYPVAQCCADHVHCCPHGMDCDVSHQSCRNNATKEAYLWQVPITSQMVTIVPVSNTIMDSRKVLLPKENKNNEKTEPTIHADGKCPDGRPCPDRFTCCQMSSGGYGCCPYKLAMCCQDKIHCCPQGTTCDVEKSTCETTKKMASQLGEIFSLKPTKVVDFETEKKQVISVMTIDKKLSEVPVTCQDGSKCPNKNTCCPLQGGSFGCCPLAQATCCSDMEHCCPHGMQCSDDSCESVSFQTSFPFMKQQKKYKTQKEQQQISVDEDPQILFL